MTFRVVLEFDPETNSYSAVCPELPGCASAGDTEDEARRNIEEPLRLYLTPFDVRATNALLPVAPQPPITEARQEWSAFVNRVQIPKRNHYPEFRK